MNIRFGLQLRRNSASLSFFILLLLFLIVSSPVSAAVVLGDDFDGTSLGAEWLVSTNNTSSWNYNVSGSNLNVSDIQPGIPATPGWSTVSLSRSFSQLDSFNANVDFSWSILDETAKQRFLVRVVDSAGNKVATSGLHDSSIDENPGIWAQIGSGSTYSSGSPLLLTDSATIDINRSTDGSIDILWNGAPIISGSNSNAIAGVELIYGYYAMYNGGSLISGFGAESIDSVTISSAPIPAALPLFGSALGLLGAMGLRKKKNS